MVNKNPEVDWRKLSRAGENTPPRLEEQSRSEGDLNRNSYRESQYPRLATRAIVNDDGTPIAGATNLLLAQLVTLTESLARREQIITQLVETVTAIGPVTTLGPLTIPGITTGSLYTADDAFGTMFHLDVPPFGAIANVIFHGLDDEGITKELVLFSAEFTETADHDPFAVGDIDILNCIGVISITTIVNVTVGGTTSTGDPQYRDRGTAPHDSGVGRDAHGD